LRIFCLSPFTLLTKRCQLGRRIVRPIELKINKVLKIDLETHGEQLT